MTTTVERLTTARDNFAAQLAAISESPKPTYTVDGRSFSWTEYQKFLLDSIDRLTDSINALDDTGNGIVEEFTEGLP